MAGSFTQTTRSLDAERARGGGLAIAALALFAAGWAAWMALARVPLHQTSTRARLEVWPAPSRVEAPLGGRVASVDLAVGKRVQAGEVLVTLDAGTLPVEIERARGQLAALAPELASLEREMAAEATGSSAGDAAGRAAVRAEVARARAADLEVEHAERELERLVALAGAARPFEVERARAELGQKRGAREALEHAGDALAAAEREREARRRARAADLERQRAVVEGAVGSARAEIARLELELSHRTLRAPVAGTLGSIAPLQPGATLAAGAHVATVVPEGELHVIAEHPPSAVGLLAPHQPARLKLDGFPWTRWGTVPVRVVRVGNEVRDGGIRVELAVEPGARMPLVHGMTGLVDVEVEQVSPATLVLRSLIDRSKGAP
jgi:membrane fusion protein (multidrug efflux system)